LERRKKITIAFGAWKGLNPMYGSIEYIAGADIEKRKGV